MVIYVNNAGLSVIAPFLSKYFEMLGMLEQDQFLDQETAARGVLLLNYIATGQTEAPESYLALNKLLCGLSLDTPVPTSIEITEHEEQVTSEMLMAILGQWKKMETSTIESLRASFLIRDGKLDMNDEDYYSLDVEKKAFDILLNSLSWSISTMNFPWMKTAIKVIWI